MASWLDRLRAFVSPGPGGTVDGVEGTAQRITRDGRLLVETASEPLLVESGEVDYRG